MIISQARVYIGVACACIVGAAVGYGGALAGWGPAGEDLERQAKLVVDQRLALDAARELNATLQAERDRREGERLVEFATRQQLARTAEAQDAELSRLRDQLAFYEQLLPPGPPGTVAIRAVELSQTTNALRYRVLLMRGGRPAGDTFSGKLQFVAQGEQDGEVRTLNLSPLKGSDPIGTEPDSESTLAVDFDQYQRSQGLLGVPEGFVLQSVTLNVLDGNVVRATRKIDAPF